MEKASKAASAAAQRKLEGVTPEAWAKLVLCVVIDVIGDSSFLLRARASSQTSRTPHSRRFSSRNSSGRVPSAVSASLRRPCRSPTSCPPLHLLGSSKNSSRTLSSEKLWGSGSQNLNHTKGGRRTGRAETKIFGATF